MGVEECHGVGDVCGGREVEASGEGGGVGWWLLACHDVDVRGIVAHVKGDGVAIDSMEL